MGSSSRNLYAGIGEGQSTTRPALFDSTNYTYWKERMRIYIRSTNFQLWLVIKNEEEVPMKKVGDKLIPKTEDEFDAEDIKKVENYAKAINMLYCAVNPDDYRKISCCSTAKEMWGKLEVTYEGTDQVREAKIDFLTQEYEMFKMKEHEKIDDLFDRFSKIVNDLHALKKTYTDRDLVRKILRSLTSEWRSKADAIYESIGTSNVTIDGLRGYDDWKIMMEAHLYALHDCMWMVLEDGPLKIQMENPERNPATPDVIQYIPKPKEKWDDRDCKKHNLDNVAKVAIFKTLDPITFSKIKHLKTAMEIWQGLGKLCEGSEDLRKQKIEVLLEKFKGFKMLPGESFDMLDERFHKILNDLASLNRVLSPKEKNVRLLRSLPTEWYTKATAMEEGRNLENYTVQGLLDELRTYEHELKKKKEEQVTPFPTTLMTASRIPSSEGTCTRNCDTPSSSQPSSSKMENYEEEFAMMVKQFRKFKKFFKKAYSIRRPSKGKPQVSDSPPESYLCYNCRKPGHWKSACPYPKVEKYGERERIEKKKKEMVAAESDESSSSSSDEEALVCMERRVEKSNHEDRWAMSEDDTLCLMAKDDADQEVTSQTSCSSSYSTPTSENLFDQFKKMMKDFEEINLKHTSLTEENKLLSEENLKLTESRKRQLNEITQLKTENESLSEKVKSLNKELGTLKSKEAVDKLLETTKHKGRKGLGFDSSSSKRKRKTTFIPPKPTAKPNKQKGKEKEKPTKVPTKEAAKYPGVWYLDSGCSRHMTGDASLLSNLIPYDGPRVTFGGSNDFGLTKGLGNLVYKGLTIQAVSYVEGLNYNLLSISQFCDKGYSLEFCKDMASLKNISTNEVILTGKRIRNIYEVIWSDVKEACLISKDKDEEVNKEDRMKPTEFIPFRSLPLKISQRNPDSDGAEPSGNFGQPSNIPDISNGNNSGNGNSVPIHPETPTTSVLQPEAELDQPVNPNQHNL
ncbi:unnamed protein product, partial [Cuscuta campestris]